MSNKIIDATSELYGLPRSLVTYLVNASADKTGLAIAYIEKDIHVTETIRQAVVQSVTAPDATTSFQGGTALAKAGLVRRFSEDIDINLVPPSDPVFSNNRRKKLRREVRQRLLDQTELEVLPDKCRSNAGYSLLTLKYDPFYKLDSRIPKSAKIGEVKIEYVFREKLPGSHREQLVSSYIGNAALELDSALLDEYSILKPFPVVMSLPIISVVDKLDAMHFRADQGDLEGLRNRARDIFDLASLLSNVIVTDQITSIEIAKIHEHLLETLPKVLAYRKCVRPSEGFGVSPAFQSGHTACEALRSGYDLLRPLVYSDADWIEFDDAIQIIRSKADLL